MRELLGYFLLAQAIITGIIVYSLQEFSQELSNSIKSSAAYVVANSGQLSWGTDYGIHTNSLLLLFAVAGIGLFLIVKKK